MGPYLPPVAGSTNHSCCTVSVMHATCGGQRLGRVTSLGHLARLSVAPICRLSSLLPYTHMQS